MTTTLSTGSFSSSVSAPRCIAQHTDRQHLYATLAGRLAGVRQIVHTRHANGLTCCRARPGDCGTPAGEHLQASQIPGKVIVVSDGSTNDTAGRVMQLAIPIVMVRLPQPAPTEGR